MLAICGIFVKSVFKICIKTRVLLAEAPSLTGFCMNSYFLLLNLLLTIAYHYALVVLAYTLASNIIGCLS